MLHHYRRRRVKPHPTVLRPTLPLQCRSRRVRYLRPISFWVLVCLRGGGRFGAGRSVSTSTGRCPHRDVRVRVLRETGVSESQRTRTTSRWGTRVTSETKVSFLLRFEPMTVLDRPTRTWTLSRLCGQGMVKSGKTWNPRVIVPSLRFRPDSRRVVPGRR